MPLLCYSALRQSCCPCTLRYGSPLPRSPALRQSAATFIYDTAILCHVHLRYGNLSPQLSMRRQSCASFIYDTAINRHVYLRYGNLSPYLSTRRQSCASFIRAALVRCHVYLRYGHSLPLSSTLRQSIAAFICATAFYLPVCSSTPTAVRGPCLQILNPYVLLSSISLRTCAARMLARFSSFAFAFAYLYIFPPARCCNVSVSTARH